MNYLTFTGRTSRCRIFSELYPMEVEDLLGMKKWHSLNLVKTTDSHARFITALPPKVETVGKTVKKA